MDRGDARFDQIMTKLESLTDYELKGRVCALNRLLMDLLIDLLHSS